MCTRKRPLFVQICMFAVAIAIAAPSTLDAQERESAQLGEKEQLDYDHDFMQATWLKLLGNLPEAASMLTRCTEVNPRDAAAHFQLAEIYTMAGDMPNALRYSRYAVRYAADNEWYKVQLAGLYLEAKLLDSATLVYRQLVDMLPDDAELRFTMAQLYAEQGAYRKAHRMLDEVEDTYGFTEEMARARYRVYAKKNDARRTEKVLKRSVAAFPDELLFRKLLAELYSATGREREARESYDLLLAADPENAAGLISMIEFYRDHGDDRRALDEMQRMYAMKTVDAELKVELFIELSADTVFFRRHQAAMDAMVKQLYEQHPDNFRVRLVNTDRNIRARDYEAARDDLLFLTARVQTNYVLWEQLIYLLNALEDNEALYEAAGKALMHFEDRYLFVFFRGYASSMLKKYDEAIGCYRRAIRLMAQEKEPNEGVELQSWVYLAEACNEQKEYAASDSAFVRAMAIAPNQPMILNNYSYYLSLRGEKLDDAERYIGICLAQEPNSSTYLDTYGWVLYRQGRIEQAITAIEKAMKNGGNDNPEIVEHLCELLTVAGRTDEAYHICKYALELKNSKETVEQKMDSLTTGQK